MMRESEREFPHRPHPASSGGLRSRLAADRPTLVLVGGFLGAGKTTLLLSAAEHLRAAGLRVGVIVNDQGAELVDRFVMAEAGFVTEAISGGCFCCRFSAFLSSAERLLESRPEVIFAEPVGSCIDLSATVLEPIRRFYRDRFRLAPLTVLVDPRRALQLLRPEACPDLAYLFLNQLAEADQVWFSKADFGPEFPQVPGITARRLSAISGEGMTDWLEGILGGEEGQGTRFLEIDYERYAQAESALGWLNWRATLELDQPLAPAAIVGPLLEALDERLTRSSAAIAHLKILGRAETGFVKASICRNGEEPVVSGALTASPAPRHELVVNLRARAAPALLQEAVDEATHRLPGRLQVHHRESFQPAPPKPEYRLKQVSHAGLRRHGG